MNEIIKKIATNKYLGLIKLTMLIGAIVLLVIGNPLSMLLLLPAIWLDYLKNIYLIKDLGNKENFTITESHNYSFYKFHNILILLITVFYILNLFL